MVARVPFIQCGATWPHADGEHVHRCRLAAAHSDAHLCHCDVPSTPRLGTLVPVSAVRLGPGDRFEVDETLYRDQLHTSFGVIRRIVFTGGLFTPEGIESALLFVVEHSQTSEEEPPLAGAYAIKLSDIFHGVLHYEFGTPPCPADGNFVPLHPPAPAASPPVADPDAGADRDRLRSDRPTD